jgi:metal-responsive CopG/Arc/MetJ family transcriptional regulator
MVQEERIPVGLNLPKQLLAVIDEKRGRYSRSAFVATVLEQLLLKGRKTKVA